MIKWWGLGAVLALAACAGRDALPIATVQTQDQTATCEQLNAEILANNIRVTQLANEKGAKVGQNVAAGIGALFIWPLVFAMDFKGAADKEMADLQARQQYLTTLVPARCAAPAKKR